MIRIQEIAANWWNVVDDQGQHVTVEYLRALERRWNVLLKEDQLGVLQDHVRRLPAPEPNFPLSSILVGGQFYRPGWPYLLQTLRTTANHCYHRPLHAQEWSGPVFPACHTCGKLLTAERCGHVNAGLRKFFGRATRVKSAYKAVPTAKDDTPNNGANAFDPRGEGSVQILETETQFIKKVEWMWATLGRAEPEPALHPFRKWDWRDISREAPEIEHRRWRVAHFDLARLRYRAPHAKVRELSRLGLTQKQIAKKLKVSERTIRTRVEELPPEAPQEMTAADLLPLIVRAGGGWARGNSWQRWTRKPFWPGGDSLPRGSSYSRPSDR